MAQQVHSILGRVRGLQARLVQVMVAAGDVDREVRLAEVERLASSPGEVAILDALMAGLLNSGVVFETRAGWFKWSGGR